MKVLTPKGRYNLETCIMCLDCVKAFDSVIRDKLFRILILKSKNISYLLLKIIIEFHAGNKSKYIQ
jgi:polyferredoxin